MSFMKDLETLIEQYPNNDLFFIIYESLSNSKFKFLDILYEASNGYGITSSEGCGFSLENDYNENEVFENVIFFIGEFEHSTMCLNDFVSSLDKISEVYIASNLTQREKVEKYLTDIRSRYKKFLEHWV